MKERGNEEGKGRNVGRKERTNGEITQQSQTAIKRVRKDEKRWRKRKKERMTGWRGGMR